MDLSKLFGDYNDLRARYQKTRDNTMEHFPLELPEEVARVRDQFPPSLSDEEYADQYYTSEYEKKNPWMTGQPKPVDQYGDYIQPNDMGYGNAPYHRGIPSQSESQQYMQTMPWYGDPSRKERALPIPHRRSGPRLSFRSFL